MHSQLNPAKTALVLIDMQNDFLHPDGAYARGGQIATAIRFAAASWDWLLALPGSSTLSALAAGA